MKSHARMVKDARRFNVGRVQPTGSGQVKKCAACQRRMICTKTGVQYLCASCRGGQGL